MAPGRPGTCQQCNPSGSQDSGRNGTSECYSQPKKEQYCIIHQYTAKNHLYNSKRERKNYLYRNFMSSKKHCRQTDAQFSFRVDDNLLAEAPTKNSYIIKMTFIALQADQRT